MIEHFCAAYVLLKVVHLTPNIYVFFSYFRLSSYEGGETKGDVVDSPTLRYVLREDQVKAQTGHAPDVSFYKQVREYGPGKVPLKAYKETIDDVVPTSDF